jgi:sugar phosphate isomerase/epimerase
MAPSAPHLSFSTLACPAWDADTVVSRCAEMGYDGIEWRGGPDGHVSTEWPRERRRELRRTMESVGVAALAVTAYSTFASPTPSVRVANADDLAAHVRLAADLGAPFVRTFLGFREDPVSGDELADRIADALRPVGELAASLGVTIAVEQHDDFVAAASLRPVLDRLPDELFGAVWDIGNAWAEGETPDATFAELSPWIRYVQVKDGMGRGETWHLTPLGAGEVPIGRALALASADLPISVEWEKVWHEELDPADVALPRAAEYVRNTLAQLATSGGR